MGSPTTKQIDLVEKITEKLNIDFPICSQEFNTQTFNNFIKYYINFVPETYVYKITNNN